MNAARKFLWIITIAIVVVLIGSVTWRLTGTYLLRLSVSPAVSFAESEIAAEPDYGQAANWVARPGMADDPAQWRPAGVAATPGPRPAAVFFISPTAYFERSRWTAPLDDATTNDRLATFARWQASSFNDVGDIWIPRYRQATLGAFFKPGADARQALALAYGDVERAFAAFLAAQPADRPLILAGHSQGSRHLLHLLQANRARLGNRIVAVYAVGWPLALPEDVAAVGLPACTQRRDSGCVLSWQSFAHDGDIRQALKDYGAVDDLSGTEIGERTMLCTHVLTGGAGDVAVAADNPGSLYEDGRLLPHVAGASCTPRGLLLLEPAPADIGNYVMPGGNFHAYDYNLFWSAVRADAAARLQAWTDAQDGAGLAATVTPADLPLP